MTKKKFGWAPQKLASYMITAFTKINNQNVGKTFLKTCVFLVHTQFFFTLLYETIQPIKGAIWNFSQSCFKFSKKNNFLGTLSSTTSVNCCVVALQLKIRGEPCHLRLKLVDLAQAWSLASIPRKRAWLWCCPISNLAVFTRLNLCMEDTGLVVLVWQYTKQMTGYSIRRKWSRLAGSECKRKWRPLLWFRAGDTQTLITVKPMAILSFAAFACSDLMPAMKSA